MGFATLGIFVLNQSGIEGSIMVMLNHGVTTGALFIGVGILYERLHTRELDRMAGVGKYMPIFAGFFGLSALSSLAFPGTNSFIGEFLVMAGSFTWARMVGQTWATVLMILVIPGIVLAAAYNLRMLQRVAYGNAQNPDHTKIQDLNRREVVTLLPLGIFILWIGLNPDPFTRVMRVSVENLLKQMERTSSAVVSTPKPLTISKSEDLVVAMRGKVASFSHTTVDEECVDSQRND
jgi:NADH-quinone oxidoreductase subunit M